MRRIGLRAILILAMVLVFGVFALFFTLANTETVSKQGQESLLTEFRRVSVAYPH